MIVETTIGIVHLIGRVEEFIVREIAGHVDISIKSDQGQEVEVPARMLKTVYRIADNGEKVYFYQGNGEDVPTKSQS